MLPSPEPPASAADIARQVAAGRVLAADVLAASLRLHEEWASRLNGLVQLRRREAEAEATAIDDTIALATPVALPVRVPSGEGPA